MENDKRSLSSETLCCIGFIVLIALSLSSGGAKAQGQPAETYYGIDFKWYGAGLPPERDRGKFKYCTPTHDGGMPNWGDNFICSTHDVGWYWVAIGHNPNQGRDKNNCVGFHEPTVSETHDNWLCYDDSKHRNFPWDLRFYAAGSPSTRPGSHVGCLHIGEVTRDFGDNYLCWGLQLATVTGRWVRLGRSGFVEGNKWKVTTGQTLGQTIERESMTMRSIEAGVEASYGGAGASITAKLEQSLRTRTEIQRNESLTREEEVHCEAGHSIYNLTVRTDLTCTFPDVPCESVEIALRGEWVCTTEVPPDTDDLAVNLKWGEKLRHMRRAETKFGKEKDVTFIKVGNNGSVSCDTYCEKIDGNGHAVWGKKVGYCVEAVNEHTEQKIPCDVMPGLLPEGKQLTCRCLPKTLY